MSSTQHVLISVYYIFDIVLQLLDHRRTTAVALSGYSRFTDNGQVIRPDFAQAVRVLDSVTAGAMSSDESNGGAPASPRKIKSAPWRSDALGNMLSSLDLWWTYMRSRELTGTPGTVPLARIRFHDQQLVSSKTPRWYPRTMYDDTWFTSRNIVQQNKLGVCEDIRVPIIVSPS
jgi:hypothetical protein